jgi:hypothetical protein
VNEAATRTRKLDAGLYVTIDGRARIESRKRALDGVQSDYGQAGWNLTVDGEWCDVYDTKRDAVAGYIYGLESGDFLEPTGSGTSGQRQ